MTDLRNVTRKAEFARLLSEYQNRLYGYIHSLVPDLNHADDVFQQTAMVLWDKFETYDRDRNFFAWACGVARFEALNFVRGLARQRRFFGHDLNLLLIEVHEGLTDDELTDRREALSRCVSKLADPDRTLLADCYTGAGGVPAAAAVRNRTSHSVYNSLRRIRLALFQCVNRALQQ